MPFRPPGDGPNPGIEPLSLVSPALAKGFFTTVPAGKAPFEFIQPPEEQHPSPARYFHIVGAIVESPKGQSVFLASQLLQDGRECC